VAESCALPPREAAARHRGSKTAPKRSPASGIVPLATGTLVAYGGVSRLLPLALALLASGGCGLSRGPAANGPQAWVSRLGGAAVAPDLSRVDAAAARLAGGTSRRLGDIFVAAHRHAGAWSWDDGSIVLTQHLLESLDDGELTAVLAHELGHLELEGRSGRRALAGGVRGANVEEAADDAGCRIMSRAGLDPGLMPCMLRHVAALEGADTRPGRSALQRAVRLERRMQGGRPECVTAADVEGDTRLQDGDGDAIPVADIGADEVVP